MGIRFPTAVPTGLAALLPHVSPAALGLLLEMLRFDPVKRPSAAQALQHEWFGGPTVSHEVFVPDPPPLDRTYVVAEPGLDEILSQLLGADDSADRESEDSLRTSGLSDEPDHREDGENTTRVSDEPDDLFETLL
jgi:serine/threonine protein kinase